MAPLAVVVARLDDDELIVGHAVDQTVLVVDPT
jgi:hypothetical protein